MGNVDTPRFYNYPVPRAGPDVPYENETQVIPVFRGLTLELGAFVISNVGFVQSHFWRNAGFDAIHNVKRLNSYTARYDPTVIPIADASASKQSLPVPTERRGNGTAFYTSADYHARYLSGELTPTAVVEALLPLIRRDASPPGKHSIAFLESQVNAVRAAAEASTQRYKNGKPLGPLDGVPVAVKDEVHVKGYKRTLGSKIDMKGGIDETSWCVRKWEEAGAIMIGKTTMHEFGLDTTNNNPNYGTPKNPHHSQYYCGGSSGGSGYVVAAGLVPIALGADGGGSIRVPSSFCGIWGLKTSHGRVSGAPTVSIATSVGVYGPMAASIDDLALSYRVMAAPAPQAEDPTSAVFPDPLSTIPTSKPKKVIGVVRPWIERAEAPVKAIFDAALEYYRTQQGYTVIDISIPYLPEGQRAHVLTIMAEIASGITPSQIKQLTAPNKVLVSLGTYQIKAQDLIAAQRLRQLLMDHLAHLFEKYPGLVIFTPTTPIPGWKIERGDADLSHGVSDGKASVRNMEYAFLANFTGCPAISCPAGYIRDGDKGSIPVGIMGMSEWGSEETLIDFARDGQGVLNLDLGANVSSSTTKGKAGEHIPEKGLRKPSGETTTWVDVFAEVEKTANAS
ncbi:hypothetical protein Plec18167_003849 [Paecilomyces lecythidis]|uniref:Amidase domain-containing protein n=1 Tax=Paecilomyces lecythidis TaxID=3004212 RepID=A0ABR3XXP7_9EURO